MAQSNWVISVQHIHKGMGHLLELGAEAGVGLGVGGCGTPSSEGTKGTLREKEQLCGESAGQNCGLRSPFSRPLSLAGASHWPNPPEARGQRISEQDGRGGEGA